MNSPKVLLIQPDGVGGIQQWCMDFEIYLLKKGFYVKRLICRKEEIKIKESAYLQVDVRVVRNQIKVLQEFDHLISKFDVVFPNTSEYALNVLQKYPEIITIGI